MVVNSSKISHVLSEVAEKEDILYVLTFAPANPEKIGKITVKLKDRKNRLLYDDNVRADYLKEISDKKKSLSAFRLDKLEFKEKKLYFAVSGFSSSRKQDKLEGIVLIKIMITDNRKEIIYNEEGRFEATKKTIQGIVNFNWLTAGNYELMITVEDLIGNKQLVDFLAIEVR